MKTLTREELEAEIIRLRTLLEQAGIDAVLVRGQQARREAAHVADMAVSRAETASARADVQVARDATEIAQAELAEADGLLAPLAVPGIQTDHALATPVQMTRSERMMKRARMMKWRMMERRMMRRKMMQRRMMNRM
ncbi:hypothetical protein [Methylorubrum sp. SB2]|uniref:hypothetical protein n=1 Tax=Methylorubrum subtropicum TaxID=3138812 RepID=UPI00313D5985